MAYQATETNVVIQGNDYYSTFTLVDDAGVMPDVRLEKHFKVGDELTNIITNQKEADCLIWKIAYLNGQNN